MGAGMTRRVQLSSLSYIGSLCIIALKGVKALMKQEPVSISPQILFECPGLRVLRTSQPFKLSPMADAKLRNLVRQIRAKRR